MLQNSTGSRPATPAFGCVCEMGKEEMGSLHKCGFSLIIHQAQRLDAEGAEGGWGASEGDW